MQENLTVDDIVPETSYMIANMPTVPDNLHMYALTKDVLVQHFDASHRYRAEECESLLSKTSERAH